MFSDFFWSMNRSRKESQTDPSRTRLSLHFNTRRRRRWLLVQWVSVATAGDEGSEREDGSRCAEAVSLWGSRRFPDPAPGL